MKRAKILVEIEIVGIEEMDKEEIMDRLEIGFDGKYKYITWEDKEEE